MIGLASPDNLYSPFVANHLNFIDPLRTSLLWGAKALLSLWGYPSYFRDSYTLGLTSGEAVRMVYSCIGYGVMSFWAAFVFANRGPFVKKAVWIAGGLIGLWAINVGRMALLLLASKNRWSIPFGWDHHTWFNIAAYVLIFGMIYLYDRSLKNTKPINISSSANQNAQALS